MRTHLVTALSLVLLGACLPLPPSSGGAKNPAPTESAATSNKDETVTVGAPDRPVEANDTQTHESSPAAKQETPSQPPKRRVSTLVHAPAGQFDAACRNNNPDWPTFTVFEAEHDIDESLAAECGCRALSEPQGVVCCPGGSSHYPSGDMANCPRPVGSSQSPAATAPDPAECRRLIMEINKQGEAIKRATDAFISSKRTARDVSAFAAALRQVGTAMEAVRLADAKLIGEARAYTQVLERLSAAAGDVNKKDAKKQAAALAELSRIDQEETRIIGAINTYCGVK